MLCINLIVLISGPWANANALQADEEALRAMIIFRLLQFSHWQKQETKLANICIIGADDVHRELSRIGSSARSNFAIKKVKIPPPNFCDVVVLGPDAEPISIEQSQRKFLICSNCNSKGLAAIHLFRNGDRIQYDINRRAAELSGVHFRSSVLKAAHKVEAGT